MTSDFFNSDENTQPDNRAGSKQSLSIFMIEINMSNRGQNIL